MTPTHAVAALLSKKNATAQTVLAQFSVKHTTANSEDFKSIHMQELAFIMHMTPLKPYINEYYLDYNVYYRRAWFVVHAKYTWHL